MERERGALFAAAAALLAVIVGIVLFIVLRPSVITMTVDSTDAARSPGETVTLHVWVEDAPGFTDLTAYVDYDHARLELIGVEDTYPSGEGQRASYLPDAQTSFDVVMNGDRDIGVVTLSSETPIREERKMLFGLTFLILPEAEIGVASVSIFGQQFTCVESEKVKDIDSAVVEGGILVGRSVCAHEDVEKDHFCDLCGAQLVVITKFDVKGATIGYGSGVELKFYFTNRLPRNKEYVAVMIHHTPDGEKRTERVKESWENYGSNYYIATYLLSATELCDEISFELRDAEGYIYNNEYSISVRELLTERLSDPKRSELEKRLSVDTLNFGAAAQEAYGYRVDDLANSGLTAEQQALATPEVVCTDSSVHGANYMGANLSIEDRVILNVYFSGFSGKTIGDMRAEAVYTDYTGKEQLIEIPGGAFLPYNEDRDAYRVVVKDLAIADAASSVKVTVYDENGDVYGSCVDSVHSYVARRLSDESGSLYTSFVKLAASVKEYLLNK
ncbi:MAG: hypothetical protein IJO88_04285 [Oscillospiraceae bacterium]|nr:hypothetical protein [Oscillospiraceae bacterium]